MARGLILGEDHRIVARPFPKFFNYTEMPTPKFVWGEPATLYEKVDGSLGIIYTHKEFSRVATRGSFASDQALWATERLNEGKTFYQPDGVTTLIEIVYPKNRVVVDYGDYEELILLGAVENATGADIPLWEIDWWAGPVANHYGKKDIDAAYRYATSNEFESQEGIVAVWFKPNQPAFRLKIKHPEYVRLHRIVTGVSNRTVWLYCAVADMVKRGVTDKKTLCKLLRHNPEEIQEIINSPKDPMESLLDNVPDEFYQWVEKTRERIYRDFSEVMNTTGDQFIDALSPQLNEAKGDIFQAFEAARADRKAFAKRVMATAKYPNLVFGLLDERDIAGDIWKIIKPDRETPFTGDDNVQEALGNA